MTSASVRGVDHRGRSPVSVKGVNYCDRSPVIFTIDNVARNPVFNQSEPWPLYHRNEPQYFIWNGNIKGSILTRNVNI
jgi:hypothetical protein